MQADHERALVGPSAPLNGIKMLEFLGGIAGPLPDEKTQNSSNGFGCASLCVHLLLMHAV